LVILVLALVVVVVVGVVAFQHGREKKRREAFRQLAASLGLRYTARDDAMGQHFSYLNALDQGHNRYAFNILHGEYQGHPVQAFDYHYETESTDSKGRRTTHDHYSSFFLLEQDKAFPELRIYPEGLLSRFGQMLGVEDMDFESVEFSKAFVVRSSDRKFAYDVCHTCMMEYLLEHQDLSLEIDGRCIAMTLPQALGPAEVPERLNQLVEIRQLFPEYLYRD